MIKNKIFTLLAMILTISILFILLSIQVQAQGQEGCCLDTGGGAGGIASKQCVTTTQEQCLGRFYTGPPYDCSNIPDCKPGTCIPHKKSEACMRNKPIAECQAIGGVPDTRKLEDVAQCKPGCCIIANGVKAEVLQFRQCEQLTKDLGYQNSMMQFKEGIISQRECKKQGSPYDLGCCVLGGGDCKYGPRQECNGLNGNFVPLQGDQRCKDVTACALTTHSYKDCGTLAGTETDIYWFDSQGNQEDRIEPEGSCKYPEAMCTRDAITGKAECKNTRCEVKGTAQEMLVNDPPTKTTLITKPIKESLLTGTSICYNFYAKYGQEAQVNKISTGLQNEILHCSFSKVEIEGLGTDRAKLCKPLTASSQGVNASFHGNVVTNNWQNCSKCGEATGTLSGVKNFVGDFFAPTFGLPGGSVFAKMGGYCDVDKCKALGDCVYHSDLFGTKAIPIVGPAPIGSCDPIYPPGASKSQCSSCGGGGDAFWNLCNKEECYSKGDCDFSSYSAAKKISLQILVSAGLAFAERTSLIAPECIATKIYCSTFGHADLACLHKTNSNPISCVSDRFATYTLTSYVAIAWKGIKEVGKVLGEVASGVQTGLSLKNIGGG